MKVLLAILLVSGILISGCVTNPLKQVAVVKVNITFIEKQDFAEVQNVTFTQGTVDYAGRPKRSKAAEFPAIAGRVMIYQNNESIIMPWETVQYTGNGTYRLNLGFSDKIQPRFNDPIHISIVVLNSTGKQIGSHVTNTKWEYEN